MLWEVVSSLAAPAWVLLVFLCIYFMDHFQLVFMLHLAVCCLCADGAFSGIGVLTSTGLWLHMMGATHTTLANDGSRDWQSR
jgi:hypothetical protein